MKTNKNSNVCIKEILFTASVLMIVTFGGLKSYEVVELKGKTNSEIESASLENKNLEKIYETALVENTEDDVYSKKSKYLAVEVIERASEKTREDTDEMNNKSYSEKIVSRGNFLREKIADELDISAKSLTEEKKAIEDTKKTEEQKTEQIEIKKEEPKKKEIKKEIKQNTEKEIVGINPLLDVSNPPTEYVKTIDVKATAYCLCKKCCGKSPSNPGYGYTASGLKIEPGKGMKVVAADPKVIPLGTKVYVQGLYGAKDYGYAVVADTGSAIKNLKIDLYMDTHQMALNWGRKTVRVYILEDK